MLRGPPRPWPPPDAEVPVAVPVAEPLAVVPAPAVVPPAVVAVPVPVAAAALAAALGILRRGARRAGRLRGQADGTGRRKTGRCKQSLHESHPPDGLGSPGSLKSNHPRKCRNHSSKSGSPSIEDGSCRG